MKGCLYGVGVGPGDPELITLKACRVLQSADLVVSPAPLEGDSLARAIAAPHIPDGVAEYIIRMPLEAARFPARAVYDEAALHVSAALEAGQTVVILCEGDPFFYGSFMYLFARLTDLHTVEVIPGVSSLMACAAVSSAPLAARNDILTVLPAPLDDVVLEARLAGTDSAVIIKLSRHFQRIAALLDRLGLAGDARYIERATMAHQRIRTLDAVKAAEVPYFSMILLHRRRQAWQ